MKKLILLLFFLSPVFCFSQNHNYEYEGSTSKTDSVYHQGQWRRKPAYDSMWVNGKVVAVNEYVYYDGKYHKKPGADSVWYNGKIVSKKYRDRLDYETYFMPGAGYSYYSFKGTDSIGNFSGVCIDYLFYAQSHQDDDFGPSHVRFYGKLNINTSDKKDMSSMFIYSLGLQMSLEKNPKRYWLIPYFGFEAGGISQKQLGSTFAFYPIAGVHIFALQNFYLNAHAGYCYPIKNFDLMQGYYAQATFNFALW